MSFRTGRRLATFPAALLTALCIPAWGMTVGPAPFDHLGIVIPKDIVAGEEFVITLRFLDRDGQAMPAGWRPDVPMTLSFAPPATLVIPSALTRDNYVAGFAFRVRCDTPGTVEMKLIGGGGRDINSWPLLVKTAGPPMGGPPDASPSNARPQVAVPIGHLEGVTVSEAKDHALVTIRTDGPADFTVSTTARQSRKWIEVHFPTIGTDAPGCPKSGRSLVGEVHLAAAGSGATVSVEILPASVEYDIRKEGTTLVLKVMPR